MRVPTTALREKRPFDERADGQLSFPAAAESDGFIVPCWSWGLPVQLKEKMIWRLRRKALESPEHRDSSATKTVQPVTAVPGQSDTNT